MASTTTRTPDTGMIPEPRKPLRKRTWFRVTGGLIAVAVIGGIAVGAAGGHAKPAAATPPAASSAPAAPAQPVTPPSAASQPAASASAAPASSTPAKAPAAPVVTETSTTQSVLFKVTGWGNPSIQYGSDSDSRQAAGGLGELGDGNALPWSATMPYTSGAMYWAVTAQLEGGGDITASVCLVTTHHYSNGTSKTDTPELLKSAHASGGYQIANAEYVPGF